MSDQATQLRRLVCQVSVAAPAPRADRTPVVVLAGGKGGVGTTTIAVSLSAALARQGHRRLLIDASANGSAAATLCRLAGRFTLADVLAGRRRLLDALEPGPAGMRVLAGAWASGEVAPCAPSAPDALVEQLRGVADAADLVVVDGGNSPGRTAGRLWQAADLVLLVTTPELASVMNAYAAVKTLAAGNDLIAIRTLVNLAPSASAADDVHARLALGCRRFLGIPIQPATYVPYDAEVGIASQRAEPFVLAAPRCHASRQIARLAELVAGAANWEATPDNRRCDAVAARSAAVGGD